MTVLARPRSGIPDASPRLVAGVLLGVLVVMVLGMRLLPPLGIAAAWTLLLALVYVTYRWPASGIVAAALVPLSDPWLLRIVFGVPAQPQYLRYVTELTLAAVSLALLAVALRRGLVGAALRQPATPFVLAFVGIAAISALVNGVPPVVAAAGVIFTLDAVAFIYLVRIAPWTDRAAQLALGALVLMLLAASLLAIVQALLAPDILGFRAFAGSFGEGSRVTGFFANPNMLGAMLGLVTPLTLFPLRRTRGRLRWLLAAVSFVFLVTLFLTFSRGAWLGALVGMAVVALLFDRVTLLIGIGLAVVAFGVATVMPRNVLVGGGGAHYADVTEEGDYIESTLDRFGSIGTMRDLRTRFIVEGLPIVRDHPIIGVGPGRYGGAGAYTFGTPVYAEYDTSLYGFHTVHNFWLHLLGEVGVLGTVAYLGILGAAAFPILRTARRRGPPDDRWRSGVLLGVAAGAGAIIVNSGTEMLLEGNSAAFPFWFVVAMGLALVGLVPSAPHGEPAARGAAGSV